MSEVEHVLAAQDEVGETPLWIPQEQALYWIDIEGRRVHRLEPATGGSLHRLDPDGAIHKLDGGLAVANPTCMAFGGEGLDELYITTAWFLLSDEDRKAQPTAGDLFRVRTDVKGLEEPSFAG